MDDTTKSDAQALANMAIMESPEEGAYDRVLGVARNAQTGDVEAILRTSPDADGKTQTFFKSAKYIQLEKSHDSDAMMSPGFEDVDLKHAGKTDDQIVAYHQTNEAVLDRAALAIKAAEPNKAALPTTDQALAQYNAPGYKAPAVDTDFVRAGTGDNDDVTKNVGIARNMDGAPVAILATAPDASGRSTLVEMTKEQLQQQLNHDRFAQQDPGLSDHAMYSAAYGKGAGMEGAEEAVRTFHQANENVVSAAAKDLDAAVTGGAALPSVQDMAAKYQAALSGVDLKGLNLGTYDGVPRTAGETGAMVTQAALGQQQQKSPDAPAAAR